MGYEDVGGHVGIEGFGREMEKVVEGEERTGSDRGSSRRSREEVVGKKLYRKLISHDGEGRESAGEERGGETEGRGGEEKGTGVGTEMTGGNKEKCNGRNKMIARLREVKRREGEEQFGVGRTTEL